MFSDKRFYRLIFSIGIPIALQSLLTSLVNMIDTVMIGKMGEEAIAAVGLSNQLFFLVNLFVFGIVSGGAIFIAQHFGKGDMECMRRSVAYSLSLAIIAGLIFTIMAVLFPEPVMRIYTKESHIIFICIKYLRITGLGYILTAVSITLSVAMRTTGQAKIPLYTTMLALVINTVLNYILIFGKLSFPRLGVEGAAIATLIARTVEFILILYFIYAKKSVLKLKLRDFKLDAMYLKRFLKTAMPVVLNEGTWALGMSMYSIAFGHMGTGAIAAAQIAGNAERLIVSLFIGLSSAASVMLGHELGAGNADTAKRYAKQFIILGTSVGFICGLLLIVIGKPMLTLFNISKEVSDSAFYIIVVLGLFMSVKMFNFINIVGILRSGGDTVYCLVLDALSVWLIGVPLVFMGAFWWKLPVQIVYIFLVSEEAFKLIAGFARLRSNRWVNNLAN